MCETCESTKAVMLGISSCHVLVYNDVSFTHAIYYRNKILFKLNICIVNANGPSKS